MQKLAQALDIPEKNLLTAPPDEVWTLEIKINNKEMIDMTQCVYFKFRFTEKLCGFNFRRKL